MLVPPGTLVAETVILECNIVYDTVNEGQS